MTDNPTADQPVARVESIASPGLPGWLLANDVSFAFTSYQTGQLFLVGVMPDGSVSLNQQNYSQAMGLGVQGGTIYLGSQYQIWRLENMLRPGELGNALFDAVYVPRTAQTTGDIDIHELAIGTAGRVLFVSTSFSCIAELDPSHSFRPVWRPPFITKLEPGDRCHLNGLAMENGAPAYVTMVGTSDEPGGWRRHRAGGGLLIDLRDDSILADGLSMPHSPRCVGSGILVLDSGRGLLADIDRKTGARRDVAFLPGFARGMALCNGFALITVSKPRDGTFAGLALEHELDRRNCDPWCGVVVIDLSTGDLVASFRLEGDIIELFDVAVLPGVRCPMSIGVGSPEMMDTITFDP